MSQQQQQPQQSGLRSMESKHKPIVILRCKLVIVGDACVGKSSVTQVFQSGGATYPKNYLMTIGAEFCVKQVPIPDTNTIIEFYLYDCAGQSIFNQLEMNTKYYDNTAAVIVMYDVSNVESLHSCTKWYSQVQSASNKNSDKSIIGCLVGNKCDFREYIDGTSRTQVVKEDAIRLSKDLGLKYFETSAQNNVNIDEPFKYIASEFYKRYEDSVLKADELINY